jgi:hypothetical protein
MPGYDEGRNRRIRGDCDQSSATRLQANAGGPITSSDLHFMNSYGAITFKYWVRANLTGQSRSHRPGKPTFDGRSSIGRSRMRRSRVFPGRSILQGFEIPALRRRGEDRNPSSATRPAMPPPVGDPVRALPRGISNPTKVRPFRAVFDDLKGVGFHAFLRPPWFRSPLPRSSSPARRVLCRTEVARSRRRRAIRSAVSRHEHPRPRTRDHDNPGRCGRLSCLGSWLVVYFRSRRETAFE